MRAISIRWQFILSFVVIVVLTGLIGYLDSRATTEVLDSFQEVTDVSAQAVIALTQANTAAFRAQTEAISVAFLEGAEGEEENAEEEEAEFAEAVEEAQAWLAEFSRFSTEEQSAALTTAMNNMIAASDDLLEMAEDGASEEDLNEQKEIIEVAEEAYLEVLTVLLEEDRASFDASRMAAIETANTSRTVALILIAIVTLGSVGIAFLLASQTVNPLIHLKDRAMQITAGENVADDYSYPNNEVGVLASEFNTMATRLQTQRDEAVEANAFKTNLLGRVSHELRTPLGAVIGMAGMLSVDEDLRDDHRELANYILQYSDELNVLVEQILEQSRLERAAADSKLVITDINPQEMLTEVQVKLTPAANHKKIEIELIMDDDMPAIIRNDSNKLRQVLNNLVGNAIKFTNEGKVTVHGRALPDDRWAVDVKDTGIGIPDEDLGKIFEAFRQGDEEYTRRYGGVGLGLSITRQFVKAMNGEISVDSSPGEGSYFTITFPTKVEMSEETTGTPR